MPSPRERRTFLYAASANMYTASTCQQVRALWFYLRVPRSHDRNTVRGPPLSTYSSSQSLRADLYVTAVTAAPMPWLPIAYKEYASFDDPRNFAETGVSTDHAGEHCISAVLGHLTTTCQL